MIRYGMDLVKTKSFILFNEGESLCNEQAQSIFMSVKNTCQIKSSVKLEELYLGSHTPVNATPTKIM